MDLNEILSISGKPGLYKVMSQAKNGMVVESLIDGKRFTAFANERMSSLEEIIVFTEDEDMPLQDIFKKIFEKQEGKAAINHKSDAKELKAFFKEAITNYDEDRVYVSDIKKILQWYNLLLDKEMMVFEEEKEDETEVKAETETKVKAKAKAKEEDGERPQKEENKKADNKPKAEKAKTVKK